MSEITWKKAYMKEYNRKYRNTPEYKARKKLDDKKYYEKNKDKINIKRKTYYENNSKSIIEKSAKWNKENIERRKTIVKKNGDKNGRKYYLKKKFGMTLEDYDLMLENQDGVCAICFKQCSVVRIDGKSKLSVDHDHKTRKC